MKINIFGVDYEVVVQTTEENPKLKNQSGLCELYAKKIVLDISNKNDPEVMDNIDEYYQKVLRHEVFHAIFNECGITDYCLNETLVELLAKLYPRIEEIMTNARKIGDEINAL